MAYKIASVQKSRTGARICAQIKNGIKWYCHNTSLHGFHFITDKKLSLFTRLFFACVSCCSFFLCTYLIVLQLFDYENRSIMTTVSSTAYPVWQVRFPAVIICNFNVVYKDNIQNLMNAVRKNGINEKVFIDMVYNLSSLIAHDELENTDGFAEALQLLKNNGYDMDRIMAELAQPCGDMVKKCFWQTKDVPCSHIFQNVKTSQGYCCAFNYYGTQDSAFDYENRKKLQYQYVGGAGPNLGLRLILDVEEDQYASSIRPSYGLNVLVQDGADYPNMDLIANTLLTAEELTISVTPKVYVSKNSIRRVRRKTRHCLFEDEGDLEWSSIYSYRSCISQCKAYAMQKFCNCIPFYYPVETGQRMCTLLDVPCLHNNKYEYNALGITDHLLTDQELQVIRGTTSSVVQCQCYPQCNERTFDIHTDRAKTTHMMGYEYSNMSVLNVYYNTVGCIKTEREVYFTWDRVFASIGGIFGLCLGGSVISILECFYFFGKCLSKSNATQPIPIEPRGPADLVYMSDFSHHQYMNRLGKGPFTASKKRNGF